MKKHFISFCLMIVALQSCIVSKKYHSFGYQIDWKTQSIQATIKNQLIRSKSRDEGPVNKIITDKIEQDFELNEKTFSNQLVLISSNSRNTSKEITSARNTIDSTKPQVNDISKEMKNQEIASDINFKAENKAKSALLSAKIGRLLFYSIFFAGFGVTILFIAQWKVNRASKLAPNNTIVLECEKEIKKIRKTILLVIGAIIIAMIIGLYLLVHL